MYQHNVDCTSKKIYHLLITSQLNINKKENVKMIYQYLENISQNDNGIFFGCQFENYWWFERYTHEIGELAIVAKKNQSIHNKI